MKNSGKQILLSVLSELSTKIVIEECLAYESKKLKAAMLYHLGTSEDTFQLLKSISWVSDEVDGELVRQGIAVGNDKLLISDLFEDIWSMPIVSEMLQKKHPGLNQRDIESALVAMWSILSSVQMFTELIEAENQCVDLEEKIESMLHKIDFSEF